MIKNRIVGFHPGFESALLVAIVPLIRRDPLTTAANDLLFLFLWFTLVACILLGKRIPRTAVSWTAVLCLVPVVGLGVAESGTGTELALVSFWVLAMGLAMFSKRRSKEAFSRQFQILVLSSLGLSFIFLVASHVFFKALSPTAFQEHGLPKVVLLYLGMSAFCAFVLFRREFVKNPKGSVVWISLVILTVLLLSESRHYLRLWRGRAETHNLVSKGRFRETRELLRELFELSAKKGMYSIHADLLLIIAELDIDEGFPGSAAGSLVWIAERVPDKRDKALALLDAGLLGALGSLPEAERAKYPIFSDLEFDPEGGFILLDRWGRLFHRSSEDAPFKQMYETTLPPGRFAADFEIVGKGILILDDHGSIYPVGDVGDYFKNLTTTRRDEVRDAVDFEIAVSGKGLYIQNAYGEIASIGETKFTKDQVPHRWNYRIIKALVLFPDDAGALMLDGRGGLHGFGDVPFDPSPPDAPYWPDERAADVEIFPSGKGAVLISDRGEWALFGDTPLDRSRTLPEIPAVDLEISSDETKIAVLTANGDVNLILLGAAPIEKIDLAEKAKVNKDYTDLWTEAFEAAAYDPGLKADAAALFDAELYADATLSDEGFGYHKGAFRDLKRHKGQSFILDAWGRIWKIGANNEFLLHKTIPIPAREWPVDLDFSPDSDRTIVLTDRGRILTEDGETSFLKDLQPLVNLESAVDLQIDWKHNTAYVLDAFGEIHPLGNRADAGQYDFAAKWDTKEAVSLALLNDGLGMAILDRFGGIHLVGETLLDGKLEDAPYWSEAVAAGLVASSTPVSLAVVDRFGAFYPFGEWKQTISKFHFPEDEFKNVIDVDYDSADNSLHLLESNGKTHSFPMDDKIASFYIERADRYIEQRRPSEAVNSMARAVYSAPEKAYETLAHFDGDFIKKVAAISSVLPDQSPLIVDALPYINVGELWLLDCFGRIFHWNTDGCRLLVNEPVPLSKFDENRAVAFTRFGDRFIVLDSDGNLTVHWQGGFDRDAGYMAGDPSRPKPIDVLAVGGGALILDRFGRITPYGSVDADTLRLPSARWDFPIARKLARIGKDIFVLDGCGGVHGPDGSPENLWKGSTYFGSLDLARDFAPDRNGGGFYCIDFAGRISLTDGARPKIPNWLMPAEPIKIWREVQSFERTETRGRKDLGLPEPDFTEKDYDPFDGAVALAVDPRESSIYMVYETGRVDFIRNDPETAATYKSLGKTYWANGDYEASVREYTRSMGTKGDPQVYTEFDLEAAPKLPELEAPFLRHYRDLEPAPDGKAFLLDRWGRIFLWEEDKPLSPVSPEPIFQKDGSPDGATAFRRDKQGGFIVLTSDGNLHVKGPVEDWAAGLVQSWESAITDAVDLALDSNAQSIFIASTHGKVFKLSDKEKGFLDEPNAYWEHDAVPSIAYTKDGIVILDNLGGIHGNGLPEIVRKKSPYLPEPLITDFWVNPQGNDFAVLRVDGTVYFSGDLDRSLWDNRLIPTAAGAPYITYQAVDEASRLRFSPAVDIEILPFEPALYILRGNGDVILVRKNEKSGTVFIDKAHKAEQERNLQAQITSFDRAFLDYPPLAENALRDGYLARDASSAGIESSTPTPLFVDFQPLPGGASYVLLDRWGRLFRLDENGFSETKPPTETAISGADAVGFTSLNPEKSAIGYSNGVVELCVNGKREKSMTIDLDRDDWLVSLKGIENSNFLFAASSRGTVSRVDPESGETTALQTRAWEFPLVAGYLPESDAGGYLLDVFGRVYNIGRCAIFTRHTEGEPAPEWKEPWGGDLAFMPDRDGLLLLDKFGGIHPLGRQLPDIGIEGLPYFKEPYFVKVRSTDGRIFVMDGNGKVYSSRPSREQ